MKLLTLFIIFTTIFINSAFAGGAAARMKQERQMMQQRQMMIQQRMIQKKMMEEKLKRQQIQAQGEITIPGPTQTIQRETKPEEIHEVDITDLFEDLTKSSHSWKLIIDKEAKEATVAHFINYYRSGGVIIRKPAALYVNMIDSMSQENPDLLNQPFPNVIQFMAIVEYDFDNGKDRDAMARQVLGEQGFIENRKRLSGQ